jgi:hypothetical protein
MTTKIRKKNTPLENLNNAIFILWLFFGGPLLFILTVGLSLYLLFINLAVNLVLVIFYKIYQKNGKCRTPLIITRIIAIVLVFISISIPFIPASCCYTKQMYPIQRFTYVHGVRQSANEILPKKLPQNISDYYFRTQLNFPAQDYSPYSYLSFYTDKDSIAELEEKCKKKGGYTTEAEMTYSEYIADLEFTESELNDKELMLSYKSKYLESLKFSLYVFDHLNKEKQNELDENLVVYRFKNKRHGYAFDYDSGLVVVWG